MKRRRAIEASQRGLRIALLAVGLVLIGCEKRPLERQTTTDSSDASIAEDSKPTCPPWQGIAWGLGGGNGPRRYASRMSWDGRYTVERFDPDGSGGLATLSCTANLDRWHLPSPAAPSKLADVKRALAHPDVVAALGTDAASLFGVDTRPGDGTIMHIDVNGRAFDIGPDCPSDGPRCVPVPSGVRGLEAVLQAIDGQERRQAPCAALN